MLPVNANATPTVTAYSRLAGLAMRTARESLSNPDGTEVTQEQFRFILAAALGLPEPLRRVMISHMEKGRTLVPAATLIRVADLAGWTLDQLMERAMHRMVHGHAKVIILAQANPHPSRVRALIEGLREVDAAEFPARETTSTESERGRS